MECLICRDVARSYHCSPCVTDEVSQHRALALATYAQMRAMEASFLTATNQEIERRKKRAQLERRREKIKQLKAQIQEEQGKTQKARTQLTSIRTFHTAQLERVTTARVSLAQYQSDYAVKGDEIMQIQRTLAASTSTNPAVIALAAASPPVTPQAVARSKRRMQMNPHFTRTLGKYLYQLRTKLAKYRLHIIDQLLRLYIIKRKSANSCTIVGLELMDDPEAMFLGVEQQRHLLSQQPQSPGDGMPSPMHYAPGTDPEIVAAALGYIVLVLHMISCYLSIRLPYTVRFHGSHSYILFNDEESTRYYLTLLDNTNANHFRRAITLLNHNIQYVCEQMTSSTQQLNGSKLSTTDPLATLNLAPLHLLPNMLKMIETVYLHLRQQHSDPYREHEERVQQATLALQKSNAALLAKLPRVGSSPHMLDPSMSQSIVTVSKQDAYPPLHHIVSSVGTTTAASSLPSAQPHPSIQRLDSPPFYSDYANKSVFDSSANMFADLSSPAYRHGHSPIVSPAFSQGGGGTPSSLPPLPPLSMQHSDLLQPSQFFNLPPNGYLSAEEPRESVLLPDAHAHLADRHMKQHHSSISPTFESPLTLTYPHRTYTYTNEKNVSSPSHAMSLTMPLNTPLHAAYVASPTSASSSAVTSPSHHGSTIHTPTHAKQSGTAVVDGTVTPPSNHAINSPVPAPVFPSSSRSKSGPSAVSSLHHQITSSHSLLSLHQQQQSQRIIPPLPTPPSYQSTLRSFSLPAVSYASEAEVDWDLVDVVMDETEHAANNNANQARRR